jgi:predicted alpha-1,2-mannosidase
MTKQLLASLPILLFAAMSARSTPPVVDVNASLTQYVNVFVGTENSSVPSPDPVPAGSRGGDFPGATTPFGMVQWTPMTPSVLVDPTTHTAGWDEPVGYVYHENTIIGFPLTQMSGSGCHGNEGEIPVMPSLDPTAFIQNPSPQTFSQLQSNFDHKNEQASPGYYKVTLNDEISVELTATTRTGFGRFTYPSGAKTPCFLIDTTRTNTIYTSSPGDTVEVAGENAVSGSTVGGNFCGARNYTVYFYAEFDHKITATINSGRAAVQFDTSKNPTVLVKIGISYVSVANAKANLDAENPGWDFDQVRTNADDLWQKSLKTIEVSSNDYTKKRLFYTALYHMMLSPNTNSDVNGQYLGFDQKTHQADAGRVHYANYSNWDIYRCLSPMLGMLFPKRAGDMMQSMVDDASAGGAIPRWSPINDDAGIMPGDSGVPVVVGAYTFGATNFDTAKALYFMTMVGNKDNAQCNSDYLRDSPQRMNDYLARNYIPIDDGFWAGSVAFEFEETDFAISCFAQALGDNLNAKLFLDRSSSWKNQFNLTEKSLECRHSDGTWQANAVPNQDMVEGNQEQYTWMLPFDTKALFQAAGGIGATIKRLDAFFSQLNAGISLPNFYLGNEPTFTSPWLYNWTGSPWKTEKVVQDVLSTVILDTPGGLPGNDDLGAISCWTVWANLGLYPEIQSVAGLTATTPTFDNVIVHWADGANILTIHANLQDELRATGQPLYIQSLNLRNKSVAAPWIWLNDLRGNSTLTVDLSQTPTNWGNNVALMPNYGLDNLNGVEAAFDNTGIESDGSPAIMGLEGYTFDEVGYSYSSQELAKAGAAPGGSLVINNVQFQWPSNYSGLNNIVTHGQTIRFPSKKWGSKLAILGSATNGAAAGTVIVTYDDNSQATFTLKFDDWTLGGGSETVGTYDSIALTTGHRLDKTGNVDPTKAYVYYWDTAIDSKHAVKSITLPFQTDSGSQLHIFSIAVQ